MRYNKRIVTRFLTLIACFGLFVSCKHDVDMYADYKEVPIVYGVLDANADTNFIKITRAFYAPGDASQIAMNPDSSNYPGRLDARLTEYLNDQPTREIILDTITIHNKQEGAFYAPDQKLYYTAETLNQNATNKRYKYRLTIVFPKHDTISTLCDIVGNSGFKVQSLAFNFSQEYFGRRKEFRFKPAVNAGLYEFRLGFTFLEQRTPDGDSVPRTMYWNIGTYEEEYLANHLVENCYIIEYYPEAFYKELAEFIGGDTAIAGLSRYITDYPIELTMSACGKKLKQYIYYNDPSHLVTPGDLEFSLVEGGYGVFSSRMTKITFLRLGGTTVPELIARTNWGFKFIGGEYPDEDNGFNFLDN